MTKAVFRYFSTFSGIGGFELGIQNAFESYTKAQQTNADSGHSADNSSDPLQEWGQPATCVGYSEIDKYATKVYERQFGANICGAKVCSGHWDTTQGHGESSPSQQGVESAQEGVRPIGDSSDNISTGNTRKVSYCGPYNYGDITKINADELPDFDCLVGGFPCQAFSIAGKRGGFDDTRGTLFFDLARILRAKQPMYGVFENVKGLVNHDKGQTLDVILEKLQELGYYCNWEIYNSKDFGVPQNRERVYLVCQNLRGLTNIGQSEMMTSSERLIQSYLFQLLLNNLNEVKKLQEHESKDSVLSYLILREINQSQRSSEKENTSAGITTGMVESKSQLRGEEAWQNIATWLSKELDVDLNEPNTSTISTAIKKITPSTTYTFSQMQQLIWLATVVLRRSQKSLWNEVLSDLTVIQEGTKYARINHKTEEAIVTESGTVHLSHVYQDQHDKFIKRHLRGTPRPEVFSIAGTDGEDIVQINQPTHSNDRVYASDGISPTLNTMQGGNRQPKIVAQRGRYNADGKTEQQLEPRSDDISNTLTAVQKDNMVLDDVRIRRLTPVECERLQAFPDNWTKYAADGTEISDTQRYKMCGNAVTTNVIQDVFERIFNGEEVL